MMMNCSQFCFNFAFEFNLRLYSMDSYVNEFQAAGGSMVMLAKGNRSAQVSILDAHVFT